MTDHIYWKEGSLYVLDQRALPFRKVYVRCRTLADVIEAIKNMTIRGAPLIGIVAAYGVVLGVGEALQSQGLCTESEMERICAGLIAARPTAVNLAWAVDRMKDVYRRCIHDADRLDTMIDAAIAVHVEDIENNRMLSLYGAELINDGDTVLTHCNAGALATGGYGTALGVIRAAHESGKQIKVIATETRPYLQGARLTVWELSQEGIDVELVPDNHVGLLCSKQVVDKVVVGADRIALNGDTANKIGTYMIALCAHQSHIPFFVAAPGSTFDGHIGNGSSIEIEERDGEEVKYIQGKILTVKEVKARYYSFDVTPGRYISNFITEKGIIERPFRKYIRMLCR
ncbi:MAG: S-methyl-5-thioribose-1-phosphate isomerase [Syntrophorhabdus aromaticivorans]|uniref:Methylthioribose-1-phosphate isomerase n=1 Tax=Syntrophorhabdus aromaticivorans TaxID=328301 RepID=A0A971M3B3_9BACT|nr:S-methyl-5-thioribose-1-phosphate isomerase [Syntrophorhabdus aromaticivorans]